MYNVVVWHESTMSNVQYDGQYMLGVSDDHFTFYREGGSLTAKVQTSWPEGFTVEGLPAWISYSIKPSATDEKIVTFTVTEQVDTDRSWPERPEDAQNALKAAYVKAGRMKWFLGFEQSKDINVNLRIFADEACSQQTVHIPASAIPILARLAVHYRPIVGGAHPMINLFICLLYTSYTHLDVYKRQGLAGHGRTPVFIAV